PTHYLLLVGTTSPLQLNLDQIRQRISTPAVMKDLASIGLNDEVKLLSCLFKDRDQLLAFTQGVDVNSDQKPLLEFSVPRASHAFSLSTNLELFTREFIALAGIPDDVIRARTLIVSGHIEYNKPGSHYEAAAQLYRKAQALTPNDSSLGLLIDGTTRTAVA